MSKQVLDVQQMQHLQELGLELKETLLLHCEKGDKVREVFPSWMVKKEGWEFTIPAYTLHDVLDALPTEINPGTRRFWLRIDLSDECLYYYYDDYKFVEHRKKAIGYDGANGLIDAAYELLCWAIENKFVETNKNE